MTTAEVLDAIGDFLLVPGLAWLFAVVARDRLLVKGSEWHSACRELAGWTRPFWLPYAACEAAEAMVRVQDGSGSWARLAYETFMLALSVWIWQQHDDGDWGGWGKLGRRLRSVASGLRPRILAGAGA